MKPHTHQWLIISSLVFASLSAGLLIYFTSFVDYNGDALITITTAIEDKLQQQDKYVAEIYENFSEGRLKLHNEPSKVFPTFIYSDGKLISWTDHHVVPSYEELKGDYNVKFLETSGASLIVKRRVIEARNTHVEIFSCLIIERKYTVENKYISSGINQSIIPYSSEVRISNDPSAGHPFYYNGEFLFGVSLREGFKENIAVYFNLAFTLCIVVYVLMCLALYFYFEHQTVHIGFLKSTFLLFGGLVMVRFIYYAFNLPQSISDSKLFSAKSFYADVLNQSIGDLLFNIIALVIFFWFVFSHFYRFKGFVKFKGIKPIFRLILGSFLALFTFISIASVAWLVQSIAENSQITIDISSTSNEDYLRGVFYVVIVLISVLFFIINHIFLILIAKNRVALSEAMLYYIIAYLAIAVYIVVSASDWQIVNLVILHSLYSLLVYKSKWILSLGMIRYRSYLYFFSAAVVCAVVVALAVNTSIDEKMLVRKQKFANFLLLENDVLAEYLIHEAVGSIQEDVQLKSRFLSPQFVNKQLFDRIKRTYMHTYLDKYEINIGFYDVEGEPVGQTAGADNYKDLSTSFQKPEYATGFPEIFFVNDAVHFDLSRYFVFLPIQRYDVLLGYLVIELRLKMYMSTSAYPELLVDKRFSYANEEPFNYAMFRNGQFVYESGSYNYLVDFDVALLNVPEFYVTGIEHNNASHLGVKGADGKVFVITSDVYPFKSILSNFSFTFQILLLLIAVLSLLNAIAMHFKQVHLNFATRLQLYLSVSMFLPLLFISVAILNSLNKSYYDEIEKGYRAKTENISRNINADLKDFLDNKINKEQLLQTVNDISRYAQSDINLYDAAGKLLATSQPLVFESNLISYYINPYPFYQIIAGEEEAITYDEQIGNLAYRSTYEAIRSIQEGKLMGVLSIPFFQSKTYLEAQKIEVFNSIINIVTFIFLASFIMTNFATSLLTRPLNLLANKLRKTRLDGDNQPLNWNSNDEIGVLVSEYNRMLVNLEKSRESLSQTEKEMAWREMARQVAHEIKNPLTPMKLTLQQMQRTLKMNSDASGSNNTSRSINTLLQQIDTLSDIATSFSAFAQMPIPENRPMDLVEVVRDSIFLFQNEGIIESKIGDDRIMVNADPKLIGRIMNNLLLNAKQAIPSGRQPSISVVIGRVGSFVRVEVTDNGTGIAEDIQGKIFIPNFSTKTSGSGLGLAIARRGIEHAGGRIWFETRENEGTSFFFELPIVHG